MTIPPDRVRQRYRIRGRVQGVGFRAWCWQTAAGLHLAGTVRNDADGSVVVEAEGDPQALERFALALARGPRHARVESVEELAATADPLRDEFRVIG